MTRKDYQPGKSSHPANLDRSRWFVSQKIPPGLPAVTKSPGFSRIDRCIRLNALGAKMTPFRDAIKTPLLRQQVAGICLGLFLPFLALFTAGDSNAQGVVKSKFGDWEIRCEKPAGAASEQCALIQSVVADDKSNINLVVIVLKTSDGKSRLLRVIAPLGVLLPNGLGLKIDDTDIGRAGFVKCLSSGCVAEVSMDEKLIDQLKNGKTATFILHQTPDEGIGLPLTLQGFKEAYAKLP